MSLKIPLKPVAEGDQTPHVAAAVAVLSGQAASPLAALPIVKSHTGSAFTVIGSTKDGLKVSVRFWYGPPLLCDAVPVKVRVRVGDATTMEGQIATKALPPPVNAPGTCFTGGSNEGVPYRSIEGTVVVHAKRDNPWEVAEAFADSGAMFALFHGLGIALDTPVEVYDGAYPAMGELLIQAGLSDMEDMKELKKKPAPAYGFGVEGQWVTATVNPHAKPGNKPAAA